ncbi:MAG: hypothetical protein FJX77_02025 [Armatimonadetes bacterium]|nr:hypothetical protein [Armatimonadota bacterium]
MAYGQPWEFSNTALVPSISHLLTRGQPGSCSECEAGLVRFYMHIWPYGVGEEVDTASLWIWCPECKKTNLGTIVVPLFAYDDPWEGSPDGTPRSFAPKWFDLLDDLWEKGKLPHTFNLDQPYILRRDRPRNTGIPALVERRKRRGGRRRHKRSR